jgi:hypothetical protein
LALDMQAAVEHDVRLRVGVVVRPTGAHQSHSDTATSVQPSRRGGIIHRDPILGRCSPPGLISARGHTRGPSSSRRPPSGVVCSVIPPSGLSVARRR